MAQKLGEIQKPEVKKYSTVRKLFCLPLIPKLSEKDDQNLKDSIDQFWEQSTNQIKDLEKTGKISYIFFESITQDEQLGLQMIEQVGKKSYELIRQKIDQGAKIVVIENEEILNEFLDWSICLSVIRKSPKVFTKVYEFHKEVAKKRNNEIAKRIDETLKKNESGLLVMSDENRLEVQSNLPSDINVFLIHPPALNDIMRWFRDYWRKQKSS